MTASSSPKVTQIAASTEPSRRSSLSERTTWQRDLLAAVRQPDVMFLQTGGKQRIAGVVAALRAASVPVRVIADFDVLNDTELLVNICERLGASEDLVGRITRDLDLIAAHMRGH